MNVSPDKPSYPLSATEYGQSVATYFGGVFAPAKSEAEVRIEHHRKVMIAGLRANLLVALQRAIEDDPSIPSHRCGAVCNCNLTEWELDLLRQS
jgi:hypothetical protein